MLEKLYAQYKKGMLTEAEWLWFSKDVLEERLANAVQEGLKEIWSAN